MLFVLRNIHSFNKFLLHTYQRPDPVIGARDRVVNNTNKSPCPQRAYILVEERDNTQTDKQNTQCQIINAEEEKKTKQGQGYEMLEEG